MVKVYFSIMPNYKRFVIPLLALSVAVVLVVVFYSRFSKDGATQAEGDTSEQDAPAGSVRSSVRSSVRNSQPNSQPNTQPNNQYNTQPNSQYNSQQAAIVLPPASSSEFKSDVDRINALPAGSAERARQLESLSRRWAENDPSGALDWALLPGQDIGDQRTILSESLAHWARTDPAAAYQYLQGSSTDSSSLEYAYSSLLGQWSSDDGAAAWEAFQGKGSGLSDVQVRTMVLENWAEQDAITVSAVIADELSQGRDEAHLGGMAVRALSTQDLQSAVAWVDSLPEGSDVGTAAEATLVGIWAAEDPNAAATWLLERPPSAARDAGIQSLALSIMPSDPAAAVDWAADMNPGTQRDWVLQRTVKGWLQQDLEQASAFLNTRNEFSAREKQEMIEAAQK